MEVLVAGLGPLDLGFPNDPGGNPGPWGSLVGSLEPWGLLLDPEGDPGYWVPLERRLGPWGPLLALEGDLGPWGARGVGVG